MTGTRETDLQSGAMQRVSCIVPLGEQGPHPQMHDLTKLQGAPGSVVHLEVSSPVNISQRKRQQPHWIYDWPISEAKTPRDEVEGHADCM